MGERKQHGFSPFISFFAIFGVIFSMTFPTRASARMLYDDPCLNYSEILFKVGGHVLTIKKEDAHALYAQNENIPFAENFDVKICYHEGSPPIEASSVSFIPGLHVLPFKDDAEEIRKGGMQVGIAINSSNVLDTFDQYKERLKKADIDIKSLPIDNGFYVWKRLGRTVYISADKKFVTPNGHPLTFECEEYPSVEMCHTFFTEKGLAIGADYLDGRYLPRARWPEFYKLFQDYINSIVKFE